MFKFYSGLKFCEYCCAAFTGLHSLCYSNWLPVNCIKDYKKQSKTKTTFINKAGDGEFQICGGSK